MVRTLAVFDVDGTLTRTDTLIPFLFTVDRWRLLRFGPGRVLSAKRNRHRRDGAKEQLIDDVLRGHSLAQVEAKADKYVERFLDTLLRPVVVRRLREHQRRGDLVALASASPQFTVSAIGARLGVEHCLSTVIEPDSSGRWRYEGPNLRGEAKLRRVQIQAEQVDASEVVAYGDSSDDLPMLEWAARGFKVQTGRMPLRSTIELVERRSPAASGTD